MTEGCLKRERVFYQYAPKEFSLFSYQPDHSQARIDIFFLLAWHWLLYLNRTTFLATFSDKSIILHIIACDGFSSIINDSLIRQNDVPCSDSDTSFRQQNVTFQCTMTSIIRKCCQIVPLVQSCKTHQNVVSNISLTCSPAITDIS